MTTGRDSQQFTTTGWPWRPGNEFRLLDDGGEFFARMLQAIDAASRYVLLEMYLVRSGAVATRFIAAFGRAARRGARVWGGARAGRGRPRPATECAARRRRRRPPGVERGAAALGARQWRAAPHRLRRDARLDHERVFRTLAALPQGAAPGGAPRCGRAAAGAGRAHRPSVGAPGGTPVLRQDAAQRREDIRVPAAHAARENDPVR